jgi:hypothetical protein
MQSVTIAIKEPNYDKGTRFRYVKTKIDQKNNIIIIDLNQKRFGVYNDKEIVNKKKKLKNKFQIKTLNFVLKLYKNKESQHFSSYIDD